MRNYISNGGGNFNNFNEVIDYLKNTYNSVGLQSKPNYRAALVKDNGVYTLKVFFVGMDFTSYESKTWVIGQRLTAKAIEKIEALMDMMADHYYTDPSNYYTYTEQVFVDGEKVSEITKEWKNDGVADLERYRETWESIVADTYRKDFGDPLSGYTISKENLADRSILCLAYYDHKSGLTLLRGLACKWENVEE